jgi:integrase
VARSKRGEIKRYLTRSYFKALHAKPIAEVKRADVNACIKTIKRDNGTVSALRALTALQSMFSWAIREGLIDANPASNVNKPEPVPPRDRVLDDRELAAVWRACQDDDAGRITRLLILTAGRRGEIGGMCWSELDLEAGTWNLPKERAKNGRAHSLPLPPLATAIIESVPRADRDMLFGERSERGFTRWWQAKLTLDERLGDAVKPWRIHDLRRTVATGMANRGIQPHVVECVLNHQGGFRSGVASIYNKSPYFNEMRQALLLWSDHLRAIVDGTECKVVPMQWPA